MLQADFDFQTFFDHQLFTIAVFNNTSCSKYQERNKHLFKEEILNISVKFAQLLQLNIVFYIFVNFELTDFGEININQHIDVTRYKKNGLWSIPTKYLSSKN